MARGPAKAKATEEALSLQIQSVQQRRATFCILGTSPLIYNRMVAKARQVLLLGGRKKTAADKAGQVKHDPPEEYRNSVYRFDGEVARTRLKLPAPAFKGAMTTAALYLPGTRKTEIGRLVWIDGPYVEVWGVPKLYMEVVRSADFAHTPDIRTRAILPAWACRIAANYVHPNLNDTAIGNLLQAAGILAGIGDFRQEKGKGSYGQFQLVNEDDPAFQQVIATGGLLAQDAALEDYEAYDADTAEMLEYYTAEIARQGRNREAPTVMPELPEIELPEPGRSRGRKRAGSNGSAPAPELPMAAKRRGRPPKARVGA